jgi:hypothetical protein
MDPVQLSSGEDLIHEIRIRLEETGISERNLCKRLNTNRHWIYRAFTGRSLLMLRWLSMTIGILRELGYELTLTPIEGYEPDESLKDRRYGPKPEIRERNTATNGIAFTIDCKQFCIRLVDGQWQMARGGQGTPFTNIEENHHVRTPLPPGTLVKDHERNIVGMIQEATENAPVTHAMAHVELGQGVPSPEKSFGQVAFEQWFKTDSSERWSICTEERKKRFNEEAQAVIDEFLRRNHVVPQSQYDAVQADLTKQWKDNEQLRKDYDHTVKREAGIIEQRNQLAVQLTESKHTAVGYLNELRHNRLTNGEELKAYDELKTTHASLQHKYDHLKESAVDAVQAFGVLEFEANATTGIVVASGWLSHANKQIAKLRKEVTS